uniref:Ig kappa chain V region K29-213 n=1 Tax=Larimichthys crocea TaxID=215358 RepID=A0A0F8AKY9_LARCR
MTPPNVALLFTCLFVVNMGRVTTLKQASLHSESVSVEESVTLPCSCQDAKLFYWYKQDVGQKPKLVSTFYSHNNNSGTFNNEFQNNPRFSLDTENQKYNLKISDLQISDSATYHCVKSNTQKFEFCRGTTISVKGSGLNIPALVHQSASETIQPGGSVTLNCTVHTGTCDGEHSVYWFKDSEESHPGLIYTHGGRNDQCERKPNTQTHTCVYNLQIKNPYLFHDGTYDCAVASCGHILFGEGAKLDFEGFWISTDEADSLSLVYFLSGALTFTTVLVVLLTFSVYKMKKRNCQCTVVIDSFIFCYQLCQDKENLHYAALRVHKANRSRRERDNTESECVYSSVKP